MTTVWQELCAYAVVSIFNLYQDFFHFKQSIKYATLADVNADRFCGLLGLAVGKGGR